MRNNLHILNFSTYSLTFISQLFPTHFQSPSGSHSIHSFITWLFYILKPSNPSIYRLFSFAYAFSSICNQSRRLQFFNTKFNFLFLFSLYNCDLNIRNKQIRKNLMTSTSQSSTNHNHSCCQHKSNLSDSQINHLINTIKLRYISPYKIIYMINQQEADYFKLRNQASGCCASSLITIPQNQMTKTQLYLFQAIKQTMKSPKLNQILEQLADKYENIVKSGEKQNLKVDDQVEKFLMEKTLSQGFNLHLFKTVADRLKKDGQQISNSAMLWATPNTWYAKYPKTPLNFLSSQTLSSLNNPNQGFAFQPAFLKDYKDNLLKELTLLQRDGKFEEQIWAKQQEHIRSDKKVLRGLEKFSFDGSEDCYRESQIKYPNLKRSLLTLRSIPFELNAKLNAFCTISENNQVSYFKENLVYKVKESAKVCRYSTFCLIGDGKVKCWIKGKKSETRSEEKCLQSGQLVLVDNELCEVQLEGKGGSLFLFKSWIGTLAKKS